MRTIDSTTDMQHRAEEALRSLLSQVSTIKVREIRRETHMSRRRRTGLWFTLRCSAAPMHWLASEDRCAHRHLHVAPRNR